MIDIVLIDGRIGSREALAHALRRERGLAVVGEAGSIVDLEQLLAADMAFGVALVDLAAGFDAGEAIARVHHRRPAAASIVLAGERSNGQVPAALVAGAVGVVSLSEPIADLVAAIRRAHAGELLVDAAQLREAMRTVEQDRRRREQSERLAISLTAREREVLQFLTDGLTNGEIARKLQISRQTQRTHTTHILSKLGVHSQLQAVVTAIRHGIVTLPDA